jgi:beta-glucosidase
VNLSEGIFMGYRHFDKSAVKPMFPFGFGLSYTTFAYSNASVDKTEFTANDMLKVKVEITNTGKYDGAEIVQLYISDVESSLARPIKELKDFGKVSLKKGETKILEFILNKDAFSFYNPEIHKWVAEPGDFKIILGSSSVDLRKEIPVKLIE